MSRAIDNILREHLIETVTTLATCWRVTRTDGVVVGFTSHDSSIEAGGLVFKASGVSQTDTAATMGLDVDTTEVHGLIDDEDGVPEQVLNKLYDGAKIDVFELNYKNPPAEITETSVIWVKSGVVGDAIRERGAWVIEARTLTDLLRQSNSVKTSRLCRAEFGDHNCRADLSQYRKSGFITGYSGRVVSINIPNLGVNDARRGLLELSNGVKFDIDSNTADRLTLTEPPAFDPTGLTGVVTFGCNKWITDCQKYNNMLNYYGEPYVPDSDDWVAGYFNTVNL